MNKMLLFASLLFACEATRPALREAPPCACSGLQCEEYIVPDDHCIDDLNGPKLDPAWLCERHLATPEPGIPQFSWARQCVTIGTAGPKDQCLAACRQRCAADYNCRIDCLHQC